MYDRCRIRIKVNIEHMVLSDRSQMSDRCLMCASTCELQLQFMSANFIFHPNEQSDYTILGDDSMIKNQSSMLYNMSICYHLLMDICVVCDFFSN